MTVPLSPTLVLDPSLRAVAPALRLGSLRARVTVGPATPSLINALDAAAEAALAAIPAEGIAALPAIEATRAAYKALGKDPARYRAASEALYRRVLQGKGLYRVNSVVDVNNLMSLRTALPIGTYDLARIKGPAITFRRAGAGETYPGIGRGPLNLEGLPVFADALGPFGSPTSDSERTMIREETTHILMVLIAFDGRAALEADLTETANALAAHSGAHDIETHVVA